MTESWRTDISATPASIIATAEEDATQVASTLKSSWIRRFMPHPSTEQHESHGYSSFASDQGTSQGFDQMGSSAIRRSRSCSSLFRDADYCPRRSKRTQEAQALENELGYEEISVGHAFSPKKSRCAHSLSVSLDRRSFLQKCRASGAMPSEEETLERLNLHSSDETVSGECAMSSLFRGPLPYSNFGKFQNSEMKHETTKGSVSITGICSKDEPKGFAALLTPIPSPACLSRRYERCEEASSTTNLLNKDTSNYRQQQHENSDSSSKATHSALWNHSTPSDSQDFVLSRPQPQNKPGETLTWLNRWSASACDEAVESSTTSMTVFEDGRSKSSSRYVPSAAAMAILGKSSMNIHSSSTASWCNSVASWHQSEDCDAKDLTHGSSRRKP